MTSRYTKNITRDSKPYLFNENQHDSDDDVLISPYQNKKKVKPEIHQNFLSSLESQSFENMGQKLHVLKKISTKIGLEINKSVNLNKEINDKFEDGKSYFKKIFRQIELTKNASGISFKLWMMFAFVFILFFLWAWIF